MVVDKVVALVVVSKCELYHFALCNSNYMYISYLLVSIFFTYFCKYVKWGSGKEWVFLTISQRKVSE